MKDPRTTQRGHILKLLMAARGGWVALPEIAACAAQYNARIFELRRLGFSIENRRERVKGELHTWFRLAPTPPPKPVPPALAAAQSGFLFPDFEHAPRYPD